MNKIQKSLKTTALDRVYVDVAETEKEQIAKFFSFRGMKQAFLESFPDQKRNQLDVAISSGSYKVSLLKDVRQFIDDHKDEVAEFIKQDAA